jgi:predicted lipoprotein with Yx(FWY)xxD motif
MNVAGGWTVFHQRAPILPCSKAKSMPPTANVSRSVENRKGSGTMRTTKVGLAARAGVAAMGIAILTLVPALGAAQAATTAGTSAVVVKMVNRSPVGAMLATTTGASLYTHPSGPCTGSCLSVWPALLMPAGKTLPKGAQCLTTVKTAGGLQVKYHGERLYTFTSDSGKSLNGNGVAGFEAATITKKCP